MTTRWVSLGDKPGEVHSAVYSMAGLAMRYLLDPQGHGKTVGSLRAMFADLYDVIPPGFSEFERAFEKHMGAGIHEYEAAFYSLMETYLAPGS